jgi:malate permease and related proteins
VILLAAVIGAATAVGVGARGRYQEGAERLAGRAMSAVLWVLLPPIAFFNIADLELTPQVGAGIGFAYAAQAVTLAAAFALGTYVLRLGRPSVGALMCSAALANTGFLGLPLTAALLGFDQLGSAIVYDTLVSAVTLVTVGFSIAAAFGTVGGRPRERARAFVTRNPPLWAAVAGFLAPAALAPAWAVDASRLAVFAVIPLGFFAVGVTLAAEAARAGSSFPPPLDGPVVCAIALKLLLPPAVVLALSQAVLEVPLTYVSQAAMASAVNNIVVANEYGLDRGLAAAAIFWTTALVVLAGLVVALL